MNDDKSTSTKKIGRDDLTEDLAVAMFREMWSELARTGRRDKFKTKIISKYNDDMLSSCPLCEWVREKLNRQGKYIDRPTHCRAYCPIKWGKDHCDDAEFRKWKLATDIADLKKYAAIIATLPRKYSEVDDNVPRCPNPFVELSEGPPEGTVPIYDMPRGTFARITRWQEEGVRRDLAGTIVIRTRYTGFFIVVSGVNHNPGDSLGATSKLRVRPIEVKIEEALPEF